MAKRVEITRTSIMAELNKLNTQLEKAQKALQKKEAAAEKYGVKDMDKEEHLAWISTVPSQGGFMTNKEDIKKNGAWFDYIMAQDRVEELEGKIENAEKRLAKAEEKVEEYHKELEAMEDLKRKEELWKLEFEQEQKEWAKDGIQLVDRYHGYTPNGKWFGIEGNSGWTMRSRHCFTLYLEGHGVVFTSGEFWRAYGVIKNN